jgi:hypothetical protein
LSGRLLTERLVVRIHPQEPLLIRVVTVMANRAQQIVDVLLEVQVYDRPPPNFSIGTEDEEVENAARNAFTAWTLALDRNRHIPSPYERQYRWQFNPPD